MKKQLTEMERLDLAAQAQAAQSFLPLLRIAFIFFSTLTVILAIASEASVFENQAMAFLAALSSVTTVMLWLRSRYAMHAATAVFFAVGIGDVLMRYRGATLSAWAIGYVLTMAVPGYNLWKRAIRFAAVQPIGWEKERSRVRQWLKTLEDPGTKEPVFEISSGSFWTGYFTRRLLKRPDCWVLGVWRKSPGRLLDFRVLEPNAVRISELPSGALDIAIEKHNLKHVTLAPHAHDSLLRLAKSQ